MIKFDEAKLFLEGQYEYIDDEQNISVWCNEDCPGYMYVDDDDDDDNRIVVRDYGDNKWIFYDMESFKNFVDKETRELKEEYDHARKEYDDELKREYTAAEREAIRVFEESRQGIASEWFKKSVDQHHKEAAARLKKEN